VLAQLVKAMTAAAVVGHFLTKRQAVAVVVLELSVVMEATSRPVLVVVVHPHQ
jgi:hypothetical protein